MSGLSQVIKMRWQQLIYQRCVACDCRSDEPICQTCMASIAVPESYCRVCGQALEGGSQVGRCQHCIARPPAFAAIEFIGTYQTMLAELIIRAKLHRDIAALAALDFLLTQYVQAESRRYLLPPRFAGHTLLAMPIPKSRLMRRGFNLPALFTQRLHQLWNMPILDESIIQLPFYQAKQAKLSLSARQKNVHNYRLYRQRVRRFARLPDKILLVDDIFTTGQTANSLATVLRKNGVQQVDLFVYCRGQLV